MAIRTYPSMNAQIVGLLRERGDVTSVYAAKRIEELELLERNAEEPMSKQVGRWHGRCFGPDVPSYLPALKVLEELGELSGHLVKRLEVREGLPDVDHRAGLIDAVGDVSIALMGFCYREGIDYDQALAATWAEVSKRSPRTRTSPASEGAPHAGATA